MTQVTSLDSIIHKYRDRLPPDSFACSSSVYHNHPASTPSFGLEKEKAETPHSSSRQSLDSPPETKAQSLAHPTFFLQTAYQNYPKLHIERQRTISTLTSPEQGSHRVIGTTSSQSYNPYILTKYKQTLDLYYNQISKNKAHHQQTDSLREKLFEVQKLLRQSENNRLKEKLEYAQKLELLNSKCGSSGGCEKEQRQLLEKIQLLEDQARSLKRNEEELKRKVREVEEENRRLGEVGSDRRGEQEISFYQKSWRQNTTPESPPNLSRDSVEAPNDTDRISLSGQLQTLRLNYQRLQGECQLLSDQNLALKQQILQLCDQIQQYKDRIQGFQEKLYQQSYSPQKSLNKTLNKRVTRNNQNIYTLPSGTQSSASNYSKTQGNFNVERKLKNLQKEYQKLSSQMLTVQSAKRIAKQTSKYYFNKQ